MTTISAQNWQPYLEKFPTFSFSENETYPSRQSFLKEKAEDMMSAIKMFGFRDWGFDFEYGDDLEDYLYIVKSTLDLLPQDKCQWSILKSYTDDQRWQKVIEVEVNQKQYKFVNRFGGWLDHENFTSNFDQILKDHAPDYIFTFSNYDFGQFAMAFIEKESALIEASKNGFPYFTFTVDWKKEWPQEWHIYFPKAPKISEVEINSGFIKNFNETFFYQEPDKQLDRKSLFVMTPATDGLVEVYQNAGSIATGVIQNDQMQFGPELAGIILAYTIADIYQVPIMLDDTKKMQRKKIEIEELEQMILARLK